MKSSEELPRLLAGFRDVCLLRGKSCFSAMVTRSLTARTPLHRDFDAYARRQPLY